MKNLLLFIVIVLIQFEAANSQVKCNPGHYASVANDFTLAERNYLAMRYLQKGGPGVSPANYQAQVPPQGVKFLKITN